MALFRMVADITLNDSQFQAGLKRVKSAASGIASQLASAFSVTAMAAFAQELVRTAEVVQDLSDQLGVTTDQVQALQRAAARSGIDVGKYAEALVRLKKAQAEALSGDPARMSQFRTLGLDPNKSPYELLLGVGKADGPQQMAAAFKLIGDNASRMISSIKEIRELGPLEVISSSSAATLSGAADDLNEIYMTLKAIAANRIANALLLGKTAVALSPAGRIAAMLRPGQPPGESFTPTMADEGLSVEEGMAAMDRANALGANPKGPEVAKVAFQRLAASQFTGLPTDELSRIGGGFGANSGLGSVEREMLRLTKSMADDINRIRETADSAANGKAPE